MARICRENSVATPVPKCHGRSLQDNKRGIITKSSDHSTIKEKRFSQKNQSKGNINWISYMLVYWLIISGYVKVQSVKDIYLFILDIQSVALFHVKGQVL